MKEAKRLPSFVAVPSDIIDKHLKTASGIYLKVILYVLRQNAVDIAAASEALGIPESDVEEALHYWSGAGYIPEEAVAAAAARKTSAILWTAWAVTWAATASCWRWWGSWPRSARWRRCWAPT